jgi:hypothetical protein
LKRVTINLCTCLLAWFPCPVSEPIVPVALNGGKAVIEAGLLELHRPARYLANELTVHAWGQGEGGAVREPNGDFLVWAHVVGMLVTVTVDRR